jgi:hypothetical protein
MNTFICAVRDACRVAEVNQSARARRASLVKPPRTIPAFRSRVAAGGNALKVAREANWLAAGGAGRGVNRAVTVPR